VTDFDKDERLPDGTLLFNASKPHGQIFGHEVAKFEQGGVRYGADRRPVGYQPKQANAPAKQT
jgi:hypothetical protein